VAGVRLDSYRFDVQSSIAANSGERRPSGQSESEPDHGPWQSAEVYANVGSGFHSNDARGTVITIDPKTGLAADKVQPLVRSRGMELGARTAWLPGLQTSLSLYRLDFDSELTYVGDAGGTEAGPPSRRYGVEFSNYYKP
jgi:outer membrane receptor for Fe3+-dicitrate